MEKETLILILNNGDQLIADVHEQSGAYVCENILNIIVHPDETTGAMRMGLMEYLPYADLSAGIAIPCHMAIVAMPGEELKNHFNQKFGKLVLPSTKIIL